MKKELFWGVPIILFVFRIPEVYFGQLPSLKIIYKYMQLIITQK